MGYKNRRRLPARASALCGLAASVLFFSGNAHADIICKANGKKYGAVKVYYGVSVCPNRTTPVGADLVQIAGGLQGPQGPAGATGPAGPAGPAGPQGPKGDKGDIGPVGPAGPVGAVGLQGPRGATGSQGVTGSMGPQGATGPAGAKGDKGDRGDQGLPGIQGPQGPIGLRGATGAQGTTGATGATGAQGPQGIQGPAGESARPGKAPYEFDLANGAGWNCKTVDSATIQDYCGDSDGCVIDLKFHNTTAANDRVLSQRYRVYMEQPDISKNRDGIPGTGAGGVYVNVVYESGGDTESVLGKAQYTLVNSYGGGWFYILNYDWSNCPGATSNGPAYNGEAYLYKLLFATGPGIYTRVTIFDN